MTSEPGPTPAILYAIVSAIVQELTGTTRGFPINFAISDVKDLTLPPSARNPLDKVSAIIPAVSGGIKTLKSGICPS
jgi:hypothetical protein